MAPVPISQSIVKVGHIDDVQEIRKNKPAFIPDRFIRDTQERPSFFSHDESFDVCSCDFPIIDLSKFAYDDDHNEFQAEISKLGASCKDWGFFQVINHGVDTSLLEKIEEVAMEFFMQPLEEKQKYPMAPGTVQGYGQAFVFSETQKLDWCNMFALGLEPYALRNPKLWPDKPPHFSETVENYSKEIRKLCKRVLSYIAMTLGLRKEVFEEMFGNAVQAIRMNMYPPCPRPDLVLGLSPHSDGSALTVLHQKKGSPVGLQLLKDNSWVPVQPLPNALVINLGDTLEVLTNGKYKSVEHRAIANKERERLSIVTFYAPSYEVELGPMAEFVNDNTPCLFRRYIHGDYSKHYVSNKLQGKRALDFAKFLPT